MSSMRKYPLIKLTSVTNQKENTSELYELKSKQQEPKVNLNDYQKQLNIYDNEMELPLEKFYANPYDYLDYIIGLYFKKLENKNEALGLEDEIMQLFTQKWNNIKTNVFAYSEKVKERLLRDQEVKNIKMKRMKQLSFSDDDDVKGDHKGVNGNDKSNNDVNDNCEIHEYRNDFYLKNPDPKNIICSEGESCLNKELMIKQAIECLKGNKISVPTKKYLSVNDLNEDYKHKVEMINSKHIVDLKFEAIEFKNQVSNDDNNESYNQYNIKNKIHKDKYYYLKSPNNKQMNVVNNITDLKHINKEKLEKQFHEEAIKTAITRMNIYHSSLPIQNYDEEEYKNEQLGLHYNDYDNDMKDDYDIIRNKLKLFLKEDNIHNLDIFKHNNKNSNKIVKKKKLPARKESAKNKQRKPVMHKEWVDNWNSKIKDEILKHERMVEKVKKRKEEERKRKEEQKESKQYDYNTPSNTNTLLHKKIPTKKNDIVDINAIIDEHDEFAQFENAPTFNINTKQIEHTYNNSLSVNKFKHQHI